MGCSKGTAGRKPGNAWNTAPDVDRETFQQVTLANKMGETNECYLARAGNPGNEQADVGQAPIGKIETISVPVKSDLTVDTQLKATAGTPSSATWTLVYPPGDALAGQPYDTSKITCTSAGHIVGQYDQYGIGKTFTFVAILSDGATELDRKPFTIKPVKVEPGMGLKFIHPLPGSTLTSKCSTDRVHPVTGESRPHKGCDFAYGDHHLGTVVAACDGEVVFAGEQTGYGNLIIIGHKDGSGNKVCMSKYAHLSEIGVSVGQKVAAGDKIGKEGNTGIGTGAHLHFEIRGGQGKGDNVYDPEQYINGTFTTAPSSDPGAPSSNTSTTSNSNTQITGNKPSSNCAYNPAEVPPTANNAALTPVPAGSDKFTHAFNVSMTEEVGGWFDPADPDTIAGLDSTKAQKRKTGWVNNSKDPGGLTKFGVSQQNNSAIDVQACTLDQAKSNYKTKYWDKNQCDSLGDRASAVWFDATVQHGGCRKILARALGQPDSTALSTLIPIAAAMPEQTFIDKFTQARLEYVSSLSVAADFPGIVGRPQRIKAKA